MNPLDMISMIKEATDFHEVYHKTSFTCYRTTKDDESQEVLIEIFDAGPEVTHRYRCRASADGKSATGNPHSTLDHVLSVVHWQDLD